MEESKMLETKVTDSPSNNNTES